MSSQTDPLGTATFNLNGASVTIINSYYVDNEPFFDLQATDGTIMTRIPQNSVAANPLSVDNSSAGDS